LGCFMDRFVVVGVDYVLSLYYSYLNPLFSIGFDNSLVFMKSYGVCKGLVCSAVDGGFSCIVPSDCGEKDLYSVLGLDSRIVFNRFYDLLGLSGGLGFIDKITLLHSVGDKYPVFITIFLSRNTDYYRNTVQWVRTLLDMGCLENPLKCRGLFGSYQYRQLMSIIDDAGKLLSSGSGYWSEVLKLLGLKNVGLKTIYAYLLHAYGYTQYAPVDRYYNDLLHQLGLNGYQPSKTICLKNKLDCSNCSYREGCLYSVAQRVFGEYNGVVQSLAYIYGRLRTIAQTRYKPSVFESLLLRWVNVKNVLHEMELLINRLREWIVV